MIGLEIIPLPAKEKVLAFLPIIMRLTRLTRSLRKQHPVSKEDVKSVGGKTELWLALTPLHKTDKTHQHVTNTAPLSIYKSYINIYQSPSSINTAMQYARWDALSLHCQ